MSGIVAIIQARLGSTRLPGKVLLDLHGKTVLERVLERAQMIPGVERTVVATTTDVRDQPLRSLAAAHGAVGFAGNEEDVLDRYYQAARQFEADVIMRLTADCPLLDPEVSRAVLARFLQHDVDYVSNTLPPTFPDGLDTEVFSFRALEQAWREARLPSEREHVTPFIWKHPQQFKLANLAGPRDWSAHRWTLDEPADLEFIRAVYARLPRRGHASFAMEAVLELLEREPQLRQLNAGIPRNAGYVRSLRETAE